MGRAGTHRPWFFTDDTAKGVKDDGGRGSGGLGGDKAGGTKKGQCRSRKREYKLRRKKSKAVLTTRETSLEAARGALSEAKRRKTLKGHRREEGEDFDERKTEAKKKENPGGLLVKKGLFMAIRAGGKPPKPYCPNKAREMAESPEEGQKKRRQARQGTSHHRQERDGRKKGIGENIGQWESLGRVPRPTDRASTAGPVSSAKKGGKKGSSKVKTSHDDRQQGKN